MACLAVARLKPLTVPNGTNVSNVWLAREVYDDAEEVMLYGPAALDALTFTIEVSFNPEAAAPTWVTLQDGSPAADVTAPAATKARSYASGLISAVGVRIKASGNVAADRVFDASKQYREN